MSGYKRAVYTGSNNIKSAFDTLYEDEYCYSIWLAGEKNPCVQHPFTDHERGRKNFDEYIEALDQAGNDDLFVLKFHPAETKKGPTKYIDKNTTVISESPFRVTSLGNDIVNGVGEPNPVHGGMSYRMFEAVDLMKKMPEALQARQLEFENKILMLLEDQEPEAPEVEPMEKYIGMAIGALKEPNVMQNVIGIIKMFAPNYNPSFMPQPQQQQPAISGVSDQPTAAHVINPDRLDNALVRLAKHCKIDEDLEKLANIAEQNPAMFNMLLMNLRA